ncbi:MAG: hypothetical protein V1911_01375 [Candidatus Micrarchaeota archaeon]
MAKEEKKIVEIKAQTQETEEEIDEAEEAAMKLAFPTATIVREMKKHIDKNKQIKKQVKIGMNKFLAEIVADVSKRMNEFPYSSMDYRMFEEAARPYRMVKEMSKEKERMRAHLDVIIKNCDSIKRDLEDKFGEKEKI